jgi:hypothetical protein
MELNTNKVSYASFLIQLLYSHQYVRLSKTVKHLQEIFILNHFGAKYRFDWEYLTVMAYVTCYCIHNIYLFIYLHLHYFNRFNLKL